MKASHFLIPMVLFSLISFQTFSQIDIRNSQVVCDCISNNFNQIGVDFPAFVRSFEEELKEKSLLKDDLTSYSKLLDHSLNIYGFVPIHRDLNDELVNKHVARITDFCIQMHLGEEQQEEIEALKRFVQKWKYINYLDYNPTNLLFNTYQSAFTEEGLSLKLHYWVYLEFLYLLMPPYHAFKSEMGGVIDIDVIHPDFLIRNGEMITWQLFEEEIGLYYEAGCYFKINYNSYADDSTKASFKQFLQSSYIAHLESLSYDTFGEGFWSLGSETRQTLVNRYPFRTIE